MPNYKKLRLLMVERRLEWKDISTIFSFSTHTISRLKNDQIVSLETLIRLCSYFNCNIGDIMDINIIN